MNKSERLNRKRFRKAHRTASRTGGQVCATYLDDGTPVYFVMPENVPDHDIRTRALILRGQPVTRTVHLLSRLMDNPGDIDVGEMSPMTVQEAGYAG